MHVMVHLVGVLCKCDNVHSYMDTCIHVCVAPPIVVGA